MHLVKFGLIASEGLKLTHFFGTLFYCGARVSAKTLGNVMLARFVVRIQTIACDGRR